MIVMIQYNNSQWYNWYYTNWFALYIAVGSSVILRILNSTPLLLLAIISWLFIILITSLSHIGDWDSGCGDWDSGCGDWDSGCGDWDSGCGDWDSGCGDWDSGCGDWDSGCGDWDSGHDGISII